MNYSYLLLQLVHWDLYVSLCCLLAADLLAVYLTLLTAALLLWLRCSSSSSLFGLDRCEKVWLLRIRASGTHTGLTTL